MLTLPKSPSNESEKLERFQTLPNKSKLSTFKLLTLLLLFIETNMSLQKLNELIHATIFHTDESNLQRSSSNTNGANNLIQRNSFNERNASFKSSGA